MVLDNFFAKKKIILIEDDWEGKKPNLCLGLFASGDDGSFGGHAYRKMIYELTGYDLSNEISPEELREMATKMETLLTENKITEKELLMKYRRDLQEYKDLMRLFRYYGNKDCYLETLVAI